MARVLFFAQLVVALVVLPLWPGLDVQYLPWGLVFLAFVLTLPAAAVLSVYGAKALRQALADGWTTAPLGPASSRTPACWNLLLSTLLPSALLGGLVAVLGVLSHWNPDRSLVVQGLILASFSLVWGFLAYLLGRVFQQVVARFTGQTAPSVVTLTARVAEILGLTPREAAATQAILDGLTYKDAAEKLFVSPSTVKSHVLSVYQKTGAGNKIELLRMVEAQQRRFHQTVDGAPTNEERS